MIAIAFFILCSIPTDWHLYDDRKGDNDKAIDIVKMIIIASALAGIGLLVDVPVWKTMIWCASWHILIFDYAIVYLLRKNHVISPSAKWWDYTGKSSKVWDPLISRLHWGVRMALRVGIFAGSLFLL